MKDGKEKKTTSNLNFWRNGFTVDETKFSTLMTLLIIAFTYVLVTNVLNDYAYTDNIFNMIKWLVGAVVGVNGFKALTSGQTDGYNDLDEYDDLG